MHYDILEFLREKMLQEENRDKVSAYQDVENFITKELEDSYTYKKRLEMESQSQEDEDIDDISIYADLATAMLHMHIEQREEDANA